MVGKVTAGNAAGFEGVTRASGLPERITAADIAKECGVSLSTVSKVMNGRQDVAASTRRRVEATILQQGYQPRGVRNGTSSLLDVVFDEYESQWAGEILRCGAAAAQAKGLAVVLTSLTEGDERLHWLSDLRARGSRGAILLLPRLGPRLHAELRTLDIPVVLVDPRGEPNPEVMSVGATNWSGGLAATRHLLELGHRRIAVIGGHPDLLCSRARVDGHRAALETAGLAVDPKLVRWSDFDVTAAFDQADALLSRSERPSAIFACSDTQALGVLEAARRHRLRVPEDLSVVGFDDLPLSRWTSPPLTTIHQPLEDMLRTAVQLILSPSRQPGAHHGIELATTLVVRESTAPPE